MFSCNVRCKLFRSIFITDKIPNVTMTEYFNILYFSLALYNFNNFYSPIINIFIQFFLYTETNAFISNGNYLFVEQRETLFLIINI